ncbi:uncharacterized protein KY384_005098 [Bacidia gigantensis]|uniref:uncharacterized protein n=1 Tax=Bacidia gigantensis TaxID=2732470 RepID=UPI001D04CB4C|nr:uncharacterized protein KY384_005098 [Bacidia gigantensis]KAG8530595.1 hypothetical protein KY384_005098 [Bacidia gigantensis]
MTLADDGWGGFHRVEPVRRQKPPAVAEGSDESMLNATDSGDDPWEDVCLTTDERLDGEMGVSGSGPCGQKATDKFSAAVLNDPENIVPDPQKALDSLKTQPKCGATCSGHSNPCTGDCHCIADTLENPKASIFKSICTDSFFAFASRRRLMASVPSGLEDDAFYLVSGPEPVPDNATGFPVAPPPSFNRLGDIVGGAAACPCNCTYISIACCTSENGMVQERPGLKLGAVLPPDGQCCNAVSGELNAGEYVGNDTTCYATA